MKTRIIDIFIQLILGFTKPKWDTTKIKILLYDPEKQRLSALKRKITEDFPSSDFQTICSTSKISFLAHVRQADVVYSYGLSKFARPDNLKLLYIGQVGNPSINVPENCKVVSAPNFASDLIADYVIASVFSYERGLLINKALQNKRKWKPEAYLNVKIKNIPKLTIGVTGLGRIGSQIAHRFQQNNIEIHVFDNDRNKMRGYVNTYLDTNWSGMLKHIDYLIMAVSNEGNANLVTSRELSLANPNLCIVNISRGDVINEKDLLHALKNKQIRGAILDVFQKEPLPKHHPFWKQEGVVITPHIAGNINLVFDEIVDDFIAHIKTSIDGLI
jgi:phosphoglycerate dehydrogenase-like enzyme